MKISLIICTYNRDKYIYDCLKSIAENNYDPENYEVLLINNNSTDKTEAECRRFQQDYPDIPYKYFMETNQGLSHARNRGIKEANGDMLVFLDDDSFASSDYLKNLEKNIYSYPDMLAFGGKITPIFESGKEPVWYSSWSTTFVSALDKGKTIKKFRGKSYPIGANMGFRKECIVKTGRFNTALGRSKKNLMGGEEKDIFNRINSKNGKIYYFPDVKVKHVIPEDRTTYNYIERLGLGIGISEYLRCKELGKTALLKRYFSETVKWGGTLILWLFYTVQRKYPKGYVLVLFRKSVSTGLFIIKNQ